ncbi:hypothetical protein ACI2L1_29785 [Streptomyces sp. NPDC019531]|uniref:hypothetical protein n=1 Tax=Streptomyces sp. NPDC019531 TaxID=3365062 RepID=UPI00384EC181
MRDLVRPSFRPMHLALAVLAAAGVAIAWHPAGEQGGDDRVEVGRVCRSTLTPGLELSCGTYGFGDLRRVCRDHGSAGRCVLTSAVTVRNTGGSPVYVSVVSGPRQGVREQGADLLLVPGQSATLRPGRQRFLFDITLRRTGDAPGSLEVTALV